MANRQRRRLVAEETAAKEATLQRVLHLSNRKKRLKKQPLQTLNRLQKIDFQYKQLHKFEQTDLASLMCRFVENKKPRKDCSLQLSHHFLKHLIRNNGLCLLINTNEGDLESLRIILEHHTEWVRDIATWTPPKTRQHSRLYSHLLRHLFAKYHVPGFLDEAWWAEWGNKYSGYHLTKRKCKQYFINWFLHIGKGGSIRKATNLPIPLTKKMAHYLLQAPDHLYITPAFRWAQVRYMGGTKKQAMLLVRSQLGSRFEHNDFWVQVIRFFLQYPQLTLQEIRNIIDYIHTQKYKYAQVEDIEGERIELPPINPKWQIKGRTLASLQREMSRWQKIPLAYLQKFQNHHWTPFRIENFMTTLEGVNYHIQQITSLRDLYIEGLNMNHCVGAYAQECFNGKSSIWSLWKEIPNGGVKRLVTIEVSKKRKVTQLSRKNNEEPTKLEKRLIRDWMRLERIEWNL